MELTPPNIAKITRPTALHLLNRPRLFAALDRVRHRAATWVTAPPGFGKTSLASSHVAYHGLDCVWYRADAEDADVGNFFCYLTQAGEALRRHDGNLPTFTPEDLPSVAAFTRRFFERLCARLQPPAIIVFDDYEDVHASCQLHALLANVVEHVPEHIHVLFLSRETMPAGFARLRGHGGITQIDADALRLTQDEAQALAASKQIRFVDKDAAVRLNELVGGWIAGLQLLLERGSLPIPNTPPNATTFQAIFDSSVQTMLATCAVLPKLPINVMAQLADAPDAVSPEKFTMLQQKAANILARFGYIEDASLLMHACGDWPSLTETILIHSDVHVIDLFVFRLCLASVLVELGKLEEAAEQFEGASRVAEGVDSDVMAHLTLLGAALHEFKRGRHGKSLVLLRGAIEKAKAIGGHYTPFYHRESLAALYALGLEANLEVEFLQTQIRRQRLLPQAAESTPENWPWPVKIYTLGRFAIAKDGPSIETHSKASRKPIELLKALIAHGGRAVHQDNFLTALWPDSDGDDAQHAFETAVYRLRKLLGAEALIVRDSSLTLNHQHCWVDCWAFERLISSAYRGVESGDTVAVARDVRKLLNLYQGSFLCRDQETAAAIVYRERLRSRLLRALERLGQFWAATGDGTKTLECYLYALEVDPSAEVFYQRLMRHYHAAGRHAEAIAVYQRCRLTLQALVGVSPCADTVNLHASTVAAASAHSQSQEHSKC